jgi:hypothetical protein
MSANVLSEIARLEGEIGRIQRELEVLKRSVGAPSSKRTQSFAAIAREMDKDNVTREMPATKGPQPSVDVTSDVVPSAEDRRNKSDRRVQVGGRSGLTDYPPATPVPSRRGSSPAPEAGRYEFVGEGTSRRRRVP